MNDPHVEEIYYRFISDIPNDNFDEADTLTFTIANFDFHLEKGLLTVKPKDHYSNIESVKHALEPVLFRGKHRHSQAIVIIGYGLFLRMQE